MRRTHHAKHEAARKAFVPIQHRVRDDDPPFPKPPRPTHHPLRNHARRRRPAKAPRILHFPGGSSFPPKQAKRRQKGHRRSAREPHAGLNWLWKVQARPPRPQGPGASSQGQGRQTINHRSPPQAPPSTPPGWAPILDTPPGCVRRMAREFSSSPKAGLQAKHTSTPTATANQSHGRTNP